MGKAAMLGTTRTKPDSPDLDAFRARLAECEAKIERGLRSFVDVGTELSEINERGLYRGAGYGTFADYCHQRWAIKLSYAYYLMDAASIVKLVSTMVEVLPPANERVARALVPLKRDPQALRVVWKTIRTTLPGEPKAQQVSKIVAAIRDVTPDQLAATVEEQIRTSHRGGRPESKQVLSAADDVADADQSPDEEAIMSRFFATLANLLDLPAPAVIRRAMPRIPRNRLRRVEQAYQYLLAIRQLMAREPE